MFDRSHAAGAIERDDSRRNRSGSNRGGHRSGLMKPDFDGPAGRTLSAVDAAQEHFAGFAPDTVVVPAREIAVNQLPHCKAPSNM